MNVCRLAELVNPRKIENEESPSSSPPSHSRDSTQSSRPISAISTEIHFTEQELLIGSQTFTNAYEGLTCPELDPHKFDLDIQTYLRRLNKTLPNDPISIPDFQFETQLASVHSSNRNGERTILNKKLTPPPSPPVRRRGPGRPSKAQSASLVQNSKRVTGHSAVRLRRQMHCDSAMRSRARLNNLLEELWNAIPRQERLQRLSDEHRELDDNGKVCRAIKVEVAIGYLKTLQGQLPSSVREEKFVIQ